MSNEKTCEAKFIPLADWSELKPRMLEALKIENFGEKVLVVADRNSTKDAEDQELLVSKISEDLPSEDRVLRLATMPFKLYHERMEKGNTRMECKYMQQEMDSLENIMEADDITVIFLSELAYYKKCCPADNFRSLVVERIEKLRELGKKVNVVTLIYEPKCDWPQEMDKVYDILNPIPWVSEKETKPHTDQDMKAMRNRLLSLISVAIRLDDPGFTRQVRKNLIPEASISVENAVRDIYLPKCRIDDKERAELLRELSREHQETRDKLVRLFIAWHGPETRRYVPEIFAEELVTLAAFCPGSVDSGFAEEQKEILSNAIDMISKTKKSGNNPYKHNLRWLDSLRDRLPEEVKDFLLNLK